uniref:Heat shock protein family A (Hsp70) member 5 n=1 Tax=Heterorhabditis bacteriophora TaxID=37862 RepID=A0A1I7W7H0_HETBA
MSSMSVIGGAVLAILIAGYIGRQYGLPPPPPKIAGVDLGTTFSSIGIYHAVSGDTVILPDDVGKRSVPSVVAFLLIKSGIPSLSNWMMVAMHFLKFHWIAVLSRKLYPQEVGSIIVSYLRHAAEKQLKTPLNQLY